MTPGTAVERYGRLWRMGQWQQRGGSFVGRIGFERLGELTEVWDEKAQDFLPPQRIREGTTSPFAIRLSDLHVAFQLRPGKIKPTSFTKALQGLLNDAAIYRWLVEHDVVEERFDQWQERVRKITSLAVKLERPNPHYRERRRVRSLLEDVRASAARIALKADPADAQGLALDQDAFLLEAIEHAQEYGTVSATGLVREQGELRETQWRSEVEGIAPQTKIPVDPDTREATWDDLRSELGDDA